jgi:hypothetical protein
MKRQRWLMVGVVGALACTACSFDTDHWGRGTENGSRRVARKHGIRHEERGNARPRANGRTREARRLARLRRGDVPGALTRSEIQSEACHPTRLAGVYNGEGNFPVRR